MLAEYLSNLSILVLSIFFFDRRFFYIQVIVFKEATATPRRDTIAGEQDMTPERVGGSSPQISLSRLKRIGRRISKL
jgi:hypothetical protein